MEDFIDTFFIKFALNAPIGYYDEHALTKKKPQKIRRKCGTHPQS
jgi:hypothetical protein